MNRRPGTHDEAPVTADELVLVHAGTAIAKVEGAPR